LSNLSNYIYYLIRLPFNGEVNFGILIWTLFIIACISWNVIFSHPIEIEKKRKGNKNISIQFGFLGILRDFNFFKSDLRMMNVFLFTAFSQTFIIYLIHFYIISKTTDDFKKRCFFTFFFFMTICMMFQGIVRSSIVLSVIIFLSLELGIASIIKSQSDENQ
jgi:hypothetical protein